MRNGTFPCALGRGPVPYSGVSRGGLRLHAVTSTSTNRGLRMWGPGDCPQRDTYPGLRLVRGETHVATAQGQTWAPWGTGGLRWQFTSTFVMTQIPQTTFERPI